MSCRLREYDMSLALDSRLPSGKRASLLRHLGECRSCSERWRAMLEAREISRLMPVYDVGSDFRESLQRRIDSGEGAPSAVYRDPIPGATKVRYVLTGAAAAAVFLVAWHVGTSGSQAQPESKEPVAVGPVVPEPGPGPVADKLRDRKPDERQPSDKLRDRQPRDRQSIDANLVSGVPMRMGQPPSEPGPLSEALLANVGAWSVARRHLKLRDKYKNVRNRPLPDAWPELEGPVTELRVAVNMMVWCESKAIVSFSEGLRTDVHEARRYIEQVVRPKATWLERERALVSLQRTRLERLMQDIIHVRCCKTQQLNQEVQDLASMPGTQHIFRLRQLTYSLEAPGQGKNEQIMVLVPQRSISLRLSPSVTVQPARQR